MRLSACSLSDVGLVRSHNEDGCFVSVADGLFMVADGMGGHAAGEVASDLALNRVREQALPALQGPDAADPAAVLAEAVRFAGREIALSAEHNPAWRGMGTTLTILLLRDGRARLLHVGDSRLYRFRDGRLEQLSDDHTLVEDQLRHGVISAEEAAASSLRHVLLQAVGVSEPLEICDKSFDLAGGDRFLLCSDGLSDMLGDERIAALFAATGQPEHLCAQLVDEAKAAGGKDNITVVVVEVEQL